jgi:hypothetical protein
MRNKIDPGKNIGLVCCGGWIGSEKQETPGRYQTYQMA